MSHNRKQRRKMEKERVEKSKSRRSRSVGGLYRRIFFFVGLVISLFVLLAIYVHPTPDWDAPTQTVQNAQQIAWGLFLQVGDVGTSVLCPDGTRSTVCIIRIPNDFGVDLRGTPGQVYPLYTSSPGDRGFYFTAIHVESQYTASEHRYTLGDFFEVWGRCAPNPDPKTYTGCGTPYPAFVAFNQGRLVYYQGNVDVYVQRGSTGDARRDVLTESPKYDQRVGLYGSFAPADGDLVTVVVHDGYTTLQTAW